jgi:hypothetical protein
MSKEPELIVQLRKEYAPEQLAAALEANADEVRTDRVPEYFTASELSDLREDFTNAAAEISDIEAEKKAAVANFNEMIKPKKLENAGLLKTIKRGYEEKEKTVYDIKDFKAGMVYTYDEKAVLISSRRMNPADRQTVIREIKTGTND